MSEEVEERTGGVEQITSDPVVKDKEPKKRVKDPKKVAAGKKLAEYNKKAKEALARETLRAEEQIKREKEQDEIKNREENGEENGKAWIPELSFTTVLSVIGIGFTAIDLYMRYRAEPSPQSGYRQNREPTQQPQSSNIPVPQPQPIPKFAGPAPPKIGML